jgi:hypothetical protein
MEIDERDQINIYDLAEFKNPRYFGITLKKEFTF